MLAAERRPWIEVSSREQREAVSSHLHAHPSTGALVALCRSCIHVVLFHRTKAQGSPRQHVLEGARYTVYSDLLN